MKHESGITMLMHTFVITIVLYFIMTMVLKQNTVVAENRSLLIGCSVLAYMIMFGHNIPPGKMNPDL